MFFLWEICYKITVGSEVACYSNVNILAVQTRPHEFLLFSRRTESLRVPTALALHKKLYELHLAEKILNPRRTQRASRNMTKTHTVMPNNS